MNPNLLIVEDDPTLNQMLSLHFEEQGYTILSTLSIAEAIEQIKTTMPDLALLDQHLPDGNGIDLLRQLQEKEPDLPIIMMTGAHDLELAIQAIQDGAYDFIHKPIQIDALNHILGRALEYRRLQRKVTALSDSEPIVSLNKMIGQSQAMLDVSKEIALVARKNVRVLITGESGTGKELVARAIHSHSGRTGPFLAINCAAIVDNLLESELFGHEKGAFTGAVVRKLGKFELASDGTLLLDEIGELSLSLQAKLLRVLQEGAFERVGGTQQITTQARIVAATNRDLEAEARAGNFRTDLLYRLNVIHINIPPLRNRREDIPLLAQGLMEHLAHSLHRKPLKIPSNTLQQLIDYDWPGNIRELENILTQALVKSRGSTLTTDLLAFGKTATIATENPEAQQGPLRAANGRLLSLDEIEAIHIQGVLEETRGHKGHSCDTLGISRPALERKIHKYSLRLPGKP